MFTFLLVVQAIIAAVLVAVILMQRSEGGGLGMGGGGGPSGLMSARGAADFLTRATGVLAALFVLMSIVLAVLAARERGTRTIDTSLAHQAGALNETPTPAPAPAPPSAVPLAATGAAESNAAIPSAATPAPAAKKPAPTSEKAAHATPKAAHAAATETSANEAKPAAIPVVAPPPPRAGNGAAPQ